MEVITITALGVNAKGFADGKTLYSVSDNDRSISEIAEIVQKKLGWRSLEYIRVQRSPYIYSNSNEEEAGHCTAYSRLLEGSLLEEDADELNEMLSSTMNIDL